MKRFTLFLLLIFLFSSNVFGQDSLKTNSIIFVDFELTPLVIGQNNMQINSSLNYQVKNSLFTFRLLGLGNFDEEFNTRLVPEIKNTLYETGLLYGLRYISDGHSLSFSAGIAADH